MERLKLPVGIESFEEIRSEGFYYIDKTGLIRDLLNNWGRGEPVHAPAAVRQDAEYEYAQKLLRDRRGQDAVRRTRDLKGNGAVRRVPWESSRWCSYRSRAWMG